MNVVVTILKVMVLGLGLLMLVGGGLCSLIMVAELGKTGGGWEILVVSLVIGGLGWVLTRAMFRTFRRQPDNPRPDATSGGQPPEDR